MLEENKHQAPLLDSVELSSFITDEELQDQPDTLIASTFWIRIVAFGKVPGFFSDAFWLALTMDLFFQLTPSPVGVSHPSLIAGCILSAFSTASAMRCEYLVNKSAQNIDTRPQKYDLMALNYVLLVGYWLDQACDRASGAGLALHFVGEDSLPRSAKITLQIITLALGLLSSVAEIATAKASMSGNAVINNKSACLHLFLLLSVAGKTLGFLGAIYWPGLLCDTLFSLSPVILELSIPALIIGCLLSAYITAAGVYCGYKINKKVLTGVKKGDSSQIPLSRVQKFVLLGYFLDQIADQAASCVIIAHILEGDKDWGSVPHLAVQAGATFFGAMTSIGYIATAKNALKSSFEHKAIAMSIRM